MQRNALHIYDDMIMSSGVRARSRNGLSTLRFFFGPRVRFDILTTVEE